ncbi:putative cytokinetic ring protein SteA [Evansella sp. AB-P1]|uniref:putative cytokinetic ring protein SteA n=1 Tax=Evansella sp. AB-P1 TaxID=3037653 RepID=UPI00241C37F3|nr:putative cytokinetic ring protein SteA [Evansella sp. AB-P1]MDG5788677.1 putative cytokinetic ring protein SteA [Evansella sp. AB-P1]
MIPYIEGKAYFGKITKQLLHHIPPHSIIIIDHEDLDIVAAEDIVRKKVLAVINRKCSMTGQLPRTGIPLLEKHNIPVFDVDLFRNRKIKKTSYVKIEEKALFYLENDSWIKSGRITHYNESLIAKKREQGTSNFENLYKNFAKNSLDHASLELPLFLDAINELPIYDCMVNKVVFVVARGAGVQNDVQVIKRFMKQMNCIILAVDGASTFLYEYQINPDFIIGDMDSIPTNIKAYTTQFIAHSYMDGFSPGQERLKKLSVESTSIPFPGMSEDLAIMLAYVSKANHIFTLGCRNSCVELIEKGRKGMGSTILTRMFAGEKISDLKEMDKCLHIPKNVQLIEESLWEEHLNITEEF